MILEQLRSATETQHRHLEERLDLLSIRTLPPYVSLLSRFHAFYEPLELRIAARSELEAEEFSFSARKKLPLLAEDLLYFDRPKPDPWPEVPGLDSFPACLGALYVVEGATLGGQVIGRHFRALGMEKGSGLSFFTGYGALTGAHWAAFRRFAEGMGKNLGEEAVEKAIHAAQDTFSSLGRCLCRGGEDE